MAIVFVYIPYFKCMQQTTSIFLINKFWYSVIKLLIPIPVLRRAPVRYTYSSFSDFDLHGNITCTRTNASFAIELNCTLPTFVGRVTIQYNVTAYNFTQNGSKDVKDSNFQIQIEELDPGRQYDISIVARKGGFPSKQSTIVKAFTRAYTYFFI